MRHQPLFSAVLATAAALSLSPTQAADLTVDLRGMRAQTGLLMVAVVDSQAGWDGQAAPVQADAAAVAGDTITLDFKDLKPGRYAVMVSHDENGNGKLDTNLIGMPVEGYGFSNNPAVMRKPTWDEAGFELDEAGAHIAIELR